jgi:2-polyprenyl-6-methoxyphenol hydroxylase-like FAD-dependent oxidoreductase
MVEENDRIAADPWVSYHRISGELIAGPEPFSWFSAGDKKEGTGSGPTRMHRHSRPKFLTMLISQLQRVGIKVEYGHRAIDYYEDGQRAGVILDDGQTFDADVVVAADGIGSKSHKLINGDDIRARSSGLAGYRANFSTDYIKGDDEINELLAVLPNGHPTIQVWHGFVPSLPVHLHRTALT